MKKQRIRFLILYALACQLQKQADFLFRLTNQPEPLAAATAETETITMQKALRGMSSETAEELPPQHWLVHKEAQAIPTHWLRKVQQGAPTLLTTKSPPVRLNAPSLTPFPGKQGETHFVDQRSEGDPDGSMLQELPVSPSLETIEEEITGREIHPDARNSAEKRRGEDANAHSFLRLIPLTNRESSPVHRRAQGTRQRFTTPDIALHNKQHQPGRELVSLPVGVPERAIVHEPGPASTFQVRDWSRLADAPASVLNTPVGNTLPVVPSTVAGNRPSVVSLNVAEKGTSDVLYRTQTTIPGQQRGHTYTPDPTREHASSRQLFREETFSVLPTRSEETGPVEARQQSSTPEHVLSTPSRPDAGTSGQKSTGPGVFFFQKTQQRPLQREHTDSKELARHQVTQPAPADTANPAQVQIQEAPVKKRNSEQQEHREGWRQTKWPAVPETLPASTWSQSARPDPFPEYLESEARAVQFTQQSWQTAPPPQGRQVPGEQALPSSVQASWPALFEIEPASQQEPDMFWQTWKRQQLLDEEQRGSRWNA